MNREERKGPRARRTKRLDGGKPALEKEPQRLRWPSLRERPSAVPTAQSARAWLSSLPRLRSSAVVAHEVAKAASIGVEGIPEEREIAAGEPRQFLPDGSAGLSSSSSTVRMKARALSSVQ